ncbi:Ionotropic receptor 266 [Frankliniella occidentalis]|nr:Ionotropic receptor 266 [Frankliniella occidentalis]
MPSGRTVSSAILLCVVLVEARCTAIRGNSPLFSRLLSLFDVNATHETLCALALIPPHLQLAGNNASATHAPRLYVFGKTDWLSEFLQRFPTVASVYLFSGRYTTRFSDFIRAGMMPSYSIALVLDDAYDPMPLIPYRVRTVRWVSLTSQLNPLLRELKKQPVPPKTCHRYVRFAMTLRPAGLTHVYAGIYVCDYKRPTRLTLDAMGVWSSVTGWSSPAETLFPPPCLSWQPPTIDERPLTAEMFALASMRYDPNNKAMVRAVQETESYEILRVLQRSYGLAFDIEPEFSRDTYHPMRSADWCRLDLASCLGTTDRIDVLLHSELSVFAWEFDALLGVVPKGAGEPYHMFHSLTVEFTAGVWTVLGAAVLVVAACLHLARRDESVEHAVLVALAPLLGQPFDSRCGAGPLRPVLGGWLLTCVVVVAAYQGQLLGYLTDPPRNREINSWKDWLESDLFYIARGPIPMDSEFLSQWGVPGLTPERFRSGFTDEQMFVETATRRDCGFLYDKNLYEFAVTRLSKNISSRLNVFTRLEEFSLQTCFFTTKGSPFEVPLRKLLGRMWAAGLQNKMNASRKRQIYHNRENLTLSRVTRISSSNLAPVLWIYAVGNLLSFVSFSVEANVFKYPQAGALMHI